MSNFAHVDKANGFDFDHMRLSIDLLAQWHATTAVLFSKVSSNQEITCFFVWNFKKNANYLF